jgi:hypothetical protein
MWRMAERDSEVVKKSPRPFSIESIMGRRDEEVVVGRGDSYPGAGLALPYLPLPLLYNSWLPFGGPLVLPSPPHFLSRSSHQPVHLSPPHPLSDDSRSESRSPLTPHDLTTKSPISKYKLIFISFPWIRIRRTSGGGGYAEPTNLSTYNL